MAQTILHLPIRIEADSIVGGWCFTKDGLLEQWSFMDDFVWSERFAKQGDPEWDPKVARQHFLSDEEIEAELEANRIDFADPWDLLVRFLSLRTEDQLLNFLDATGHFCDPDPGENIKHWTEQEEFAIHPDCFWELQGILTGMLAKRNPVPTIDRALIPELWKMAFERPLFLSIVNHWNEKRAIIEVHHTLDTMLAVVKIKLAQGSRFRRCRRADCRAPFEIASDHKRVFCRKYCAHLTAQRSRRGTKILVPRRKTK